MLKPIKELLSEELKDKLLRKELLLLPSSYQKIGDIVILNLKGELWKYDKLIGKIVLEKIPNTKSVFRRTGFIETQIRTPKITLVSGVNDTITIHKEHGIIYKLDVKNIMFSKGNLNERKRIVKQTKKGETVVDMFAGIGYFSLGIAKFSEAEKIYAIETNPKSYEYLIENIRLNNVQSKVIPILGDCAVEIPKLGRIADRVIMGLLPSCKEYLKDAMKVVKLDGAIHYHGIAKKDEEKKLFEEVKAAAEIEERKVKLIKKTKVKSYAPKVYHWVIDCEII
jgi:tRNA wybutosine-synthesizing protein 2